MTPKPKIGNLVKLNTDKLSFISKWHKFNGFVGLVIAYRPHINTYKILWCSSELQEYDFDSCWYKDYLEVIL